MEHITFMLMFSSHQWESLYRQNYHWFDTLDYLVVCELVQYFNFLHIVDYNEFLPILYWSEFLCIKNQLVLLRSQGRSLYLGQRGEHMSHCCISDIYCGFLQFWKDSWTYNAAIKSYLHVFYFTYRLMCFMNINLFITLMWYKILIISPLNFGNGHYSCLIVNVSIFEAYFNVKLISYVQAII